MTRTKKTKIKKRVPPDLRIPPEAGLFTRSARDLYNLIFFYGLGGCRMSNATIARKLRCCKRTVQRARQLLIKRQVIISARTGPHTWQMWSRYHLAVQNCQVLLYLVRQELDNPYYISPPDLVEVEKCPLGGDKMSPKLYVESLQDSRSSRLKNEAGEQQPATSLPQGSAPNPASPTGSTGNRLTDSQPSEKPAEKTDIPDKISDQLDLFGRVLFKGYYNKFIDAGYSEKRSIHLANVRALEKRAKNRLEQ